MLLRLTGGTCGRETPCEEPREKESGPEAERAVSACGRLTAVRSHAGAHLSGLSEAHTESISPTSKVPCNGAEAESMRAVQVQCASSQSMPPHHRPLHRQTKGCAHSKVSHLRKVSREYAQIRRQNLQSTHLSKRELIFVFFLKLLQ